MPDNSPGTLAYSHSKRLIGGPRKCLHSRHELLDGIGRYLGLLAGIEAGRKDLQRRGGRPRLRAGRKERIDAPEFAGGQFPVVLPLKQIEFVRCHP
jgi:hypothetical protein